MSESVKMPALGESVTEGTVSSWLKAVGDTVEADEPLLEVATDKVDTEVPSPASGVLLEIRVPEDETVEVGTVLAIIGDPSQAGSAPTPDGQPGEPGYTQPEADPVPLESPASVADAQVKLAVEAVNVEATVPGEVSGPAVRVKVTATAGSAALDLSGASVTATYGQDSTPAVMLTSDQQSQTLPDSVAAGSEATGVYDFAIPEGSRDQVVVRVYLNSQEPAAVFSGAVS